tara:strand:- start:100 stop:2841 length:2742 start_codon:yes stop_codon:yes gene_type:complete
MSEQIKPGQRWLSESEPELGLGIVVEVDQRHVVLMFTSSEVERRYALHSAPIRRIEFRVGDVVKTRDGDALDIESVESVDGIFYYIGGGQRVSEVMLDDRVQFDSPEDRLRMGHWEPGASFSLRWDALTLQSSWESNEARGFVGGKIDLLPHQLYIAHEVASRQLPRVLLADETGLGKTIEAGLILHHLHMSGRAERVLILVPEPLVNQWFVELLRRFHLIFRVFDEQTCLEYEQSEPGSNPFELDSLVLCNADWLTKSPKRCKQAIEAGWDLLLLDEAHHVREETSIYDAIAALAKASWGSLLLSATPEQLGLRSHFARLKLLDPQRYGDFEAFEAQHHQYQDLAHILDVLSGESDDEEGVKQILSTLEDTSLVESVEETLSLPVGERESSGAVLLDRYGIGRVMFRNTRDAIEGFPVRDVYLHPLEDDDTSRKPMVKWLAGLLQANPEEKCLLICRTQKDVQEIGEAIQSLIDIDVAFFHEGLSLLQRDRNAVWFGEPLGARLMVCSEIGGEGRNFQFARHLVLVDLPLQPERLEQRIGRLDRIGQADRFSIHVPYLVGSAEEKLVRWYHEGLQAFEQNFSGGYSAYETFGARLKELMAVKDDDDALFASLLEETKVFREDVRERMQKGRNRLLELASYHGPTALRILQSVISAEQDPKVRRLAKQLFEHFGVEVDQLTDVTWKLMPTSRLHESFPWLKGDAMTISFDRDVALRHDTSVFLSMDHPMLIDSLSLLLGSQEGNCSVAMWKEDKGHKTLLCEFIFVMECVAPKRLDIERYFPPTPVRVVLDHMGKVVTLKDTPFSLTRQLNDVEAADLPFLRQLPDTFFTDLSSAARQSIEDSATKTKEKMLKRASNRLDEEVERLVYLSDVNPDVTQEEVASAQAHRDEILGSIDAVTIRLDALRLILPYNK